MNCFRIIFFMWRYFKFSDAPPPFFLCDNIFLQKIKYRCYKKYMYETWIFLIPAQGGRYKEKYL